MIENENTEEFVVTARKWRPMQFREIVGQEHITTTLLNAIRGGRVHHAYLFCGPRGVGKTTTARILAKALNCVSPEDYEPCNKCETCKSIIDGRSIDIIEIDGASNNSVDDVRKLRENSKYPPLACEYKIYIIDEVHMLSTAAFNALLKTLEEPPPHLMFIFATTETHKLPATIISRCQRFDFRRMEIDAVAGQLKHIAEHEGIKIDEESLITIAKKADGSMRDGESIFDQVTAFCGREIKYTEMAAALHLIDQEFFFRISRAALNKNIEEMFNITKEVAGKGYDFQECLQGALEHFRNILTVCITGDTGLLESSGDYLERYKAEAGKFSRGDLLRILNIISSADQSMRFAPYPRIRFEMTLVQIASMDSTIEISALLEEIRSLKDWAPTPSPLMPAAGASKEPAPAYTPRSIPKPSPPTVNIDAVEKGRKVFVEKNAAGKDRDVAQKPPAAAENIAIENDSKNTDIKTESSQQKIIETTGPKREKHPIEKDIIELFGANETSVDGAGT